MLPWLMRNGTARIIIGIRLVLNNKSPGLSKFVLNKGMLVFFGQISEQSIA